MDIALTIPAPNWMRDSCTQKIMAALNVGKDARYAMFVGGCVRNAVMGHEVSDIDIATIHEPEQVITILENKNIKVIPTGIKHGTVTAVVDGNTFEITTLRQDVVTDGRHAEVAYTDDWVEDAKRRDFTMNSLLADEQGNIYDPLGKGLKDAKAGNVLFVGNPSQRIDEDYLRILRFFRFHLYYGQGEIDGVALMACADKASHIDSLSRERITQELVKILAHKNCAKVIEIMFENNILPSVIDNNFEGDILKKLVQNQISYKAVLVESRLYVLAGCRPRHYHEELRLSNAQQKFLIKLQITQRPEFFDDIKSIKRCLFHEGRNLVLQGYLLRQAIADEDIDKQFMDVIQNWDIPKFTLTGQDLMKEGYQTGPELGEELERRKEEWLEEVISSVS